MPLPKAVATGGCHCSHFKGEQGDEPQLDLAI